MMTIGDVMITWLACNLQTRNEILMTSGKIENEAIKETYFGKFQGLIVSLTWETKKLFWNVNSGL